MAALNHQMRVGDTETETSQGYYSFALQECNTAIHELVQLTRKPALEYCDKEAILLASVLFTGIGCLQGNFHQALMHVRKSLQLVDQWHFSVDTVAAARGVAPQGIIDPCWLLHLVGYFEFQAHDIDTSIPANSWKRHAYELRQERPVEAFSSVAEAYYEYMPLHFGFAIGQVPTDSNQRSQSNASSFESTYSKWRLRFQQLAADVDHTNPEERLAVSTLWLLVKCERVCRYVLRSNALDVWRSSNVEFREIVDTAEKLLQEESAITAEDPNKITPAFTFSLSAAEALRLVGFVCRNGVIRRRVMALLCKYQRRDGMWSGELSSSLIEAKMFLEEENVENHTQPDACGCELHVFACKEHRARTLGGEMVGSKMLRTSINSRAGQQRGDQDMHVCLEWE